MKLATLTPKATSTEASSSSTQVAQVRAATAPWKKKKPVSAIDRFKPGKESKTVRLGARTRLLEADAAATGATKFRVVLIQEGMGNLADCFYYTKECLQTAAALFEGVKCFADHPTAIGEQIQPERSTRDILGHYEDVAYMEEAGRGELQATLILCDGPHFDWAGSLLTNAMEYATKYKDAEFVGFSINAQGEAGQSSIQEMLQSGTVPDACRAKLQDALAQGIETLQPVSVLKDAVSVDLVTEAGAGGKILTMMERAKMAKKTAPAAAKTEIEKLREENAKLKSDNAKLKEAGAVPGGDDGAPAAGGDGGDPDHADAAQDMALFQKMIQQYLGSGEDVDQEEAMKMAQHAYEAHQEAGMAPHEAYEAAGQHLKMAMAIGKKMAGAKPAAQATPGAPAAAAEEAGHHEDMEAHHEGQTPPPSPSASAPGGKMPGGKQEAARVNQEMIKSRAEIAQLRESNSALEARMYLGEKLAASDRSPEFMKQFKEALGKPRSIAQIEQVWSTFSKAFDAGAKEGGSEEEVDEFLGTEKGGFREAGSAGGKVVNFSDCAS